MSSPREIPVSPAENPRRPAQSVFVLVAILGLSLALSFATFFLIRRWEAQRVAQSFESLARNHGASLAVSLRRYEESLFTLRDVFDASEDVTFAEFRTAAVDLRARHPGLQTLEWLPRIPHAERAAAEAGARQTSYRDFVIHDLASATPSPDREEYLPVLYLEPFSGQETIFGTDHFVGAHRAAAAAARDTGEIVATERTSLRGEAPGYFLLLAISAPGENAKTPAERQAKFRGCVKASVRLGDLLTTTIDETQRREVDVLLLDRTAGTREPFLIALAGGDTRASASPGEAEFRSGMHHAISLAVAGREWSAIFRPTAAWLANQQTSYADGFLAGGLLITALLGSYFRAARRRAAEIQETVDLRTAELRATQNALHHDIQERAAIERALRESEERYRAFILNSTEAICRYEYDPPVPIDQPERDLVPQLYERARLAECNDALARSYGYRKAAEMIGRRLGELMPADIPANIEHMEQLLRSGFQLENQESVELDREGAQRTFMNTVTGIVIDGCLRRLWSTQRDVTEQRRAEAARGENDTRLRLALAAADMGTWEWNAETGSVIFSEGTERIFGLAPGAFDGRSASAAALTHPDDLARVEAAVQRTLTSGEEHEVEHRIVRPDGGLRWVVARGAALHDRAGKPSRIVGAIIDVTELHERAAEKELMDRKLQETQKLESLGILAGGIAHDFNNLLTGILGNASLARLDLPVGSPAQASLEAIETVALRAADLCKQMLAYSGKGRFIVRRLDLSMLVRDTAELIQVSIGKNVALNFSLSDTLPPIAADATQIRQIIMNLVINASDAIGEERGSITLGTGVVQADQAYLSGAYLSPTLPVGEYVYLEVSDTGCGMDSETRERIFDPFFTTKFAGRGLGLAAVLGIVRGHAGALRVYSEPGKGSTFKLLLPAVAGGAEQPDLPSTVAPAWRTSGTVLIVDDEKTVRDVCARMLANWGCEVETAANGQEALAYFRENPTRFRAVLLDLTMPELDGTATFTELRRLHPGVRVLLMSGFNEQDAVSRFSGKGLAGFVQKPFTPEALQKALRAILEPRTPPEAGNFP